MARGLPKRRVGRRVVKTKKQSDSQLLLKHQSELMDLRNKLRKANQAYHTSDKPIMTDEKYDQLEQRLRTLSPNDKELRKVGSLPTKAQRKVSLPYSMPSLDKIKPNETLTRWLGNNPGPYTISDKLDGVSGMFAGDKLYTRGNGLVGVDISHLIPYVRGIGKLPSGVKAIRGELCFLRDTFTRKYAKKFKNARNLTSGVVNSKEVNMIAKDLIFIVHGVVYPAKRLSSVAPQLKSNRFNVVQFVEKTKLDEAWLLSYLAKRREDSTVDIDGLVIASKDSIIAFKAGYESAQVIVEKIEWNESRFGYMTPVVIIRNPVKLAGVTVSRVSAHNARFLVDNKIGKGAVIEITRSGDVIPKIMRTVKPSRVNPLPPGLGTKFDWNDTKVDLVSLSKNKSDSAVVDELVTFLIRIEVDKIKSNAIGKLVDYGITTIPDLIKTEVDEMTEAGLGHGTAAHLHDRMRQQLKAADIPTLMAASSIFGRGFGERKLGAILGEVPFKQMLTLYKQGKPTLVERISVIPGIGRASAVSFVASLPKFVKFLKEINWKPTKRIPIVVRKSGLGPAPIVVFTGFRDRNLKLQVESVGGRVANGVTKNTTHVVALKASEKTRKAERYGAKILTVEQFKKLLARR
jgi:NAD-dependent DNA ligase